MSRNHFGLECPACCEGRSRTPGIYSIPEVQAVPRTLLSALRRARSRPCFHSTGSSPRLPIVKIYHEEAGLKAISLGDLVGASNLKIKRDTNSTHWPMPIHYREGHSLRTSGPSTAISALLGCGY